jgi:hypothetical protein
MLPSNGLQVHDGLRQVLKWTREQKRKSRFRAARNSDQTPHNGRLSRFPAFQVCQDFHVSIEAGGTTGEVLGDKRIGNFGMFGQADQFGIRRTIDSLWVREGFGKILLSEAEEFFLVDFLPLFLPHWSRSGPHPRSIR